MKRKKYERNRKLIQGNINSIPKLQLIRRKKMKESFVDITKEKFDEYVTVQISGIFNIFDPRAREMTTLSKDEWVTIMREYEKLSEAWGDND